MTETIEVPQVIKKRSATIMDYLEGNETPYFMERLKKLGANQMDIDQLHAIVLKEYKENPKIQSCTMASFLSASLSCAQLGLYPGSTLGFAYLLPYHNKKTNITICQFMIGYKGMIEIAYRGGVWMKATLVYEHDEYEHTNGSEAFLHHRPVGLIQPRGDLIGGFSEARFGKDKDYDPLPMRLDEILKARQSSKAAHYEGSIWKEYFDAMAKKTCLRKHFNYIPKSIQMATAVARDEVDYVDAELQQRIDDSGVKEQVDKVSVLNKYLETQLEKKGNNDES